MELKKFLAESELVPEGFAGIGPADHPNRKPTVSGLLVRNRQTGVYALLAGGRMITVPHKWAQDLAAGMGKSADAIQDLCIARMQALQLNPNRIAELLDGQISRSHVIDYLSRRASLGSHKLQHLLPALGLKIVNA